MSRPPDTGTLARELRALSTEERAAFVAALLAARGWAVEREGRLLTASRGDRRRRIAVGAPPEGEPVDEVVLLSSAGWRPWPLDRERRARRAGVSVLDAAALRERLLYGLDRETARELLTEHLGPGVLAEADPESGPDTDTDSDSDSEPTPVPGPDPGEGGPSWRSREVGAVLAVAAVATVAAVLGGGALMGTPSGAAGAGGAPGTVTAAETPGGATETRDVEEGPPPGVTADGLVSIEALTRAHLAAIGARPGMSMNASFAGPRFLTGFDTFRSGFDADDRVTVAVRVESVDRYRIERRTSFPGGLVGGSEATLERFADGDAEYRAVDNEAGRRFDRRPLSTVRGGPAEITGWTRSVFPRYLNTTDSRVEWVGNGSGPVYRVVAIGQPRRLDQDTRDYRAVAVVAPDGFVSSLTVSYDHPRTGTTVRVTVRYGRSAVRVEPPDWYGTARERTDGGE